MAAKMIMIQGTASHVGKSVMTAALCRYFANQGYRVAPFKAQNMSNNSFVTQEGGEMGRAQVEQAYACRVEPSVAMNPILLKPSSDRSSQIVSMGKVVDTATMLGDSSYKERFMPVVESALEDLRAQYDIVVIEGAGSPAEVNLRENDIVNMGLALRFQIPVALVGDIDWGGVFAQFVGTLELISEEERKLVKGFIINKFRGDRSLLQPGLQWLEEKTKRDVLAVMPYISDFEMAEEDSLISADSNGDLSGLRANVLLDKVSGHGRDVRDLPVPQNHLLIDVIWLPRISNATDFEPLKSEKNVTLRFLHKPDRHRLPDVLILPGTKSTMADLEFLRESGLDQYILNCYQRGTTILGICGGYQMLCERIVDEKGVESDRGSIKGLGILPGVVKYQKEKRTERVVGTSVETGHSIQAYEIHMGDTYESHDLTPLFQITERNGVSCSMHEGVFKEETMNGIVAYVFGTYLHGLFQNQEFTQYFLNRMRKKAGLKNEGKSSYGQKDEFDRLAKILEENITSHKLESMMEL